MRKPTVVTKGMQSELDSGPPGVSAFSTLADSHCSTLPSSPTKPHFRPDSSQLLPLLPSPPTLRAMVSYADEWGTNKAPLERKIEALRLAEFDLRSSQCSIPMSRFGNQNVGMADVFCRPWRSILSCQEAVDVGEVDKDYDDDDRP